MTDDSLDSLLRAPDGRVHRGDADGWITCRCGARHWGLAGAAGLLAWRLDPGAAEAAGVGRVQVALQHRAWWSHHGGTWGIPGGAIGLSETPIGGALRESSEEVGLGADDVTVYATNSLLHPDWAYTTVVARAREGAQPHPLDAESLDTRWVDVAEVDAALAAGHVGGEDERSKEPDREARFAATRARHDEMLAGPPFVLLPGLTRAWPTLRTMLAPLTLIVDGANTMGSRPDGWWKDRAGALTRLSGQLAALTAPDAGPVPSPGIPATTLGAPGGRWLPDVVLVAEGAARGVRSPGGRVRIVDAPGNGDDEIVAQVRAAVDMAPVGRVVVVTADRELRARCEAAGATILGPGTLLGLLPPAPNPS